MVKFGVLGPVVAEDDRGAIDLRGPRHRAVLARLLIARGRVVPVGMLVDDLWEVPPDGAVGAVQSFVATLRRALEPGRAPRTPARLLVTESPGYALRAEFVDAWQFEAAVAESGDLLAHGRAEDALAHLQAALDSWRGPAYSEFAEEHWARAEVTRLGELRLLAVERRAEAGLAMGRAPAVAADMRAHVSEHPWREHAWQLLAVALYQAGRQRDALEALRTAKAALVAELGVDPGPDLRRLEADILAQAPRLSATPSAAPALEPVVAERRLVGRDRELGQLTAAAAEAADRREFRLALVAGEPGAGKTALVEALVRELAAAGWITAWGRNPEHEGAPATWPWIQLLDGLAAVTNIPVPDVFAGADDAVAARFHARRRVVSHISAVAAERPVLLVLDDLHRADEETLAQLTALIGEPVHRPVLLVGTYRSTELSPGLAEVLGRSAGSEPARIYLGGLDRAEVGELARAAAQREVPEEVAQIIHARSGGNPFFARELARLFDTDGDATLHAVPAGVRDVVRQRLNALPGPARTVLRQAAVIGDDVDIDLLTGTEEAVLDAVDAAVLLGFLVESGSRLRFAHALVRDTVHAEVSGPRRSHWHAKAAEALERIRPDDVEAIAHHFLLAGTTATAGRAAHYAALAAQRAERRFAPHEAARLWEAAIAAHDRSGATDPRSRLDLVMGLVRALAITGDLAAARVHRAEAITAAEALGDAESTARVIGAFDVPGIWTTNDDPAMSEQVVAVTERTLAAVPEHLVAERARLLGTLAMELRGTGSDRGREAAAEAVALARRLHDPELLAFALNGRFMHTFDRAGLAPERAQTGRELVELAADRGLVTFEVLGHLILLQAHSALAEFGVADRHAAAADELAERHELPLVAVFTRWYAAVRDAAAGRVAEAEAGYRAAAARLGGTGMWGVERGTLPLALLCLRIQEDRPSAVDLAADWGPFLPWVRPLGLLDAGDRDAAVAAARAIPESPPDLLREARLCLTATTAVRLGDQAMMEQTYAALEPAAAELAGAGSGLLTAGPVAHHLEKLATGLGRSHAAQRNHRRAAEIARKARR
ncbi:Transcriptional regulatory protein, C terminal [Saccharopolyspora antimicrobica]|uniref:Transcriptional regulator n=1 Tax=Saccharopolyspora antimicrobica TaxID=455193 RepID=A0A1I4U0Y7_9PSEU|nr:transcriptional regulator [Saccharopolyspora antimicrobica]SFM82557.1 Transcriptional regulatory protein, C terminal [Saccharopolyspora antimicrobica]